MTNFIKIISVLKFGDYNTDIIAVAVHIYQLFLFIYFETFISTEFISVAS